MAFLTDRKRADGMGSAKSGTEHHWRTQITSIALLILVPIFVFTFGPVLGEDYATVTAYYARPFPAIIAALTIMVGFLHFKEGVQVLIEDYVHGQARKFLIIAMICLSNVAILVGLYALIRLAL
jgi:succinate dehydrogenase / fumarate reductase membrane anchor subunit